MENNEHKLVRQSFCKTCGGCIRSMALEYITGEELLDFEQEVNDLDLETETITLKEFKENGKEFCSCIPEEIKYEEYELETIQDIANMITPDNIDNFLKDFRALLIGYMTAQTASDIGREKRGQEKVQIPISKFTWTDDGKVDVSIRISSENNPDESIEMKLTGENNDKDE